VATEELEGILREPLTGDSTVFALAFTKDTTKCKALAPVFRKAAKAMKSATNVRFVKVSMPMRSAPSISSKIMILLIFSECVDHACHYVGGLGPCGWWVCG
jgi:hypothetical protein